MQRRFSGKESYGEERQPDVLLNDVCLAGANQVRVTNQWILIVIELAGHGGFRL